MYKNFTRHAYLLVLVLFGCATTPDPLEKFNRGVFSFNKDVDRAVLKPLAETYKTITPEPIDQGVTNFFNNIGEVVVITNGLFQLKFKQATSDTGRLLVNSTIGLLGMIDVASQVGLPKHYEDFGQTLGYWGFNSGPYLVLPFLGPSSLRDTLGLGIDTFADPRSYATNTQTRRLFLSSGAVRIVDTRADLLGAEEVLGVAALDEYAYIRDAYLQRRDFLVHDGRLPATEQEAIENLFDDLDTEPTSSQ